MSSKKSGGQTKKRGQQASSPNPPQSKEGLTALSSMQGGDLPQEDTLALFFKLPPEEKRERFLSVSEAALRVCKAERTVRAWFYSQRIKGHYCGGTIWICVKSLLDYLSKENRRRK
jgi:hypothetical protein